MTHDKAAEFEKVTFFWFNIYGNITYSSFGVELNKKVLNSLNFQALLWGKKMKAMSGSGPGYMQRVIITPYMHTLIYHVPEMLRKHGSLKFFSGQGK